MRNHSPDWRYTLEPHVDLIRMRNGLRLGESLYANERALSAARHVDEFWSYLRRRDATYDYVTTFGEWPGRRDIKLAPMPPHIDCGNDYIDRMHEARRVRHHKNPTTTPLKGGVDRGFIDASLPASAQLVLNAIRDGATTNKLVREHTGLNERMVRYGLRQLCERNIVRVTKRGRASSYSLVD